MVTLPFSQSLAAAKSRLDGQQMALIWSPTLPYSVPPKVQKNIRWPLGSNHHPS